MAAVKGKQKEQKDFVKELFVGFTSVKVVAVNPNRSELNKLIGKEDSEDDKEVVYFGNDQEGNDRIRLAFWLEDMSTGRLFVHSFNLTDKERKNKDGDKVQVVNSTCSTTWVPYIKDGDDVTDEMDESLLPEWFVNFTDKEKNKIGKKSYRKALAGEEELVILLRSWLGRLNFFDPETEVVINTKKLFKEDYSELRDLIALDEKGLFLEEGYDSPFVGLLGVRTDETDPTKKYQQVWSKAFLPASFMKFINNGNKFPTDYAKKTWNKFKEDVTGEHGFDGYTELVPITEYDESKDLNARKGTKPEPAPKATSDY